MKNSAKILSLLLALALMFALASCGEESSSETSASESSSSEASPSESSTSTSSDDGGNVIKIGHICDLTGTEALTGAEASADMEFAVKYVEEKYGFDGYTIEVVTEDSKSEASSAADAARKLIENDGVAAIFGPTLIGHKAAVAAVCSDLNVPVIFYNPTPEDFYDDYPWIVGASGTTPQMPTVMADYVYKDLDYTSLYVLTKDDEGGRAYSEPFISYYEGLGGKVISDQYAPVESTADYAPYLVTMTDANANCLAAWTSGSAAIALWQAWYDAGLSETLPIVALFSGAFTDSFICDALNESGRGEVAEAMLGTYSPMSWAYDIESAENEEFVDYYKEEHDGAVPIGNNLAGATVQVVQLFASAVDSLGGVWNNSEELLQALLEQDINGPEGRTVFENGSQGATKDIFVTQVVKLDDGTYNYGLVKEYADVPPAGLS